MRHLFFFLWRFLTPPLFWFPQNTDELSDGKKALPLFFELVDPCWASFVFPCQQTVLHFLRVRSCPDEGSLDSCSVCEVDDLFAVWVSTVTLKDFYSFPTPSSCSSVLPEFRGTRFAFCLFGAPHGQPERVVPSTRTGFPNRGLKR